MISLFSWRRWVDDDEMIISEIMISEIIIDEIMIDEVIDKSK